MNPFQRPGDDPQKEGRRFEAFWAAFLGKEPTRGSGNQWHSKLDVGSAQILMNLKHSRDGILRFSKYRMKDLFKETQDAITGQGGVGGETIGAVVTSEDGEIYITFKGHDFLRMAQSGDIQYIVATKGEQKRMRSRIPALLREEE